MNKVNTQNLWTFDLRTQEGINVPIWIIVVFQQKDKEDSQIINNDCFYRPPVTRAQCIIGTEKYTDSAVLFNYVDDDNSQGYSQILQSSRVFTRDDILQQYMSDNDIRASDNGNNIGYNLYVFDIRYQKKLESAQPIELEYRFSENIPAGIISHALVLTNKLDSIGRDGQRHFNLI